MKDYRSIFECQRRWEEFSKSYTNSYDNTEVARLMSINYDGVDWLEKLSNPKELELLQQRLPCFYSIYRLLALSSYVSRYLSLETFIQISSEDETYTKIFLQHSIDDSIITYGEIFDLLKEMHSSYAEAILSLTDDTNIDVCERLIDAFIDNDKQTFISILRNESLNKYRLVHIYKSIHDQSLNVILSSKVKKVRFIEDNANTIRQMPLDIIKDGQFAKTVLDVVDNFTSEEIEKNFELSLYDYYKYALKLFISAEDVLSKEQKEQYLSLLLADDITHWYESAYNDCIAEIPTEIAKILSKSDTEEIEDTPEKLKLPKDFFSGHKYHIQNIPCFSLTPLPTSEQMIDIGYLLAEHGCIENSPAAIYKFIRAFTGRSINPKEEDFEKAEWLGKFKDLVFMVKFFTPDTGKKYSKILDLFTIVNPNEKQQLEGILKTKKSPSSYANNCGELEKKIKSILSNTK